MNCKTVYFCLLRDIQCFLYYDKNVRVCILVFKTKFLLLQVGVFFGGLPIQKDEEVLKTVCPHIVVGTPGRILALVRNKKLNLKHLKHFILDECDKMLELLGLL